jgi:hypothetical protein
MDGDIPSLPADGDYNCADFETRTQARIVLERDPSYPHYQPRPRSKLPLSIMTMTSMSLNRIKLYWGYGRVCSSSTSPPFSIENTCEEKPPIVRKNYLRQVPSR